MWYLITIITFTLFWMIVRQNRRRWRKRNIEHYDDRLAETSFEKCARFCKEKEGCFGFAYDKRNEICYPSKSTLLGRPVDENTLFKEEYSKNHTVCNTVGPVIEPSTGIPFEERRKNSIYSCAEKEGLQPQWYLHADNEFTNIGEGRRIDEIFDIDDYDVVDYNWPINKYDAERIDYLLEQRRKQRLTDETITSLERIDDPKPPPEHRVIRQVPLPTPTKIKPLDFGLEGVREKARDVVNELQAFPRRSPYDVIENFTFQEGGYPSQPQEVHGLRQPGKYLYDAYDDSNAGEYLRNYRCVENIPLNQCLDYCSGRESCVGSEHNTKFGQHRDVCCPYRTIGRFEPRRYIHRNGKFYVKNLQEEIDSKTNLIRLKQNANTKDITLNCQLGGL